MVGSIEEYLKKREKRVQRRSAAIRDPRPFDFNFIPSKPLMREELRPVIDALLRFSSTEIANNVLIVGSRGSGKTLSLLHLKELLFHKGLSLLYVNCRVHNTSYKILAHLLGVRARGLSFDELAARFNDRYSTNTVVILDEIDLLSERDKSKEILYFLSRSEVGYLTILLSNNPRWVSSLDESVQSTLQPEMVYFRPYSAAEIFHILEERADTALSSVSRSVLKEIAALTVKMTDSDVRVAILTLYFWAVEPEMKVSENFQRARRDVVTDMVKNLSDKNLLILKAGVGPERPVKDIYASYRGICRMHREEPFSYVYFCNSLSYLQSLGLVLLVSTKHHRTYAKVMQLTFPPEILDTFWRLRFG